MPDITRYEILATKPGQPTYLIGYTPRLSKPGLFAAIRAQAPAIIARLGIPENECFGLRRKPRMCATASGWEIGFTGRTQREAQQRGPHPFIGAKA